MGRQIKRLISLGVLGLALRVLWVGPFLLSEPFSHARVDRPFGAFGYYRVVTLDGSTIREGFDFDRLIVTISATILLCLWPCRRRATRRLERLLIWFPSKPPSYEDE